MRTFQLNMFIDRPLQEVYNHLAEPINMIGLQPFLTSIDILKEQKREDGIILRPFHTVETIRQLGLPVWRNRIYVVIHLNRPHTQLEYHVFAKPGIQLIFRYTLQETDEGRTHLVQKVSFEKVNRLFENIVFNHAIKNQRAMLANLKVRLEKS